jgi:hypothetical protein
MVEALSTTKEHAPRSIAASVGFRSKAARRPARHCRSALRGANPPTAVNAVLICSSVSIFAFLRFDPAQSRRLSSVTSGARVGRRPPTSSRSRGASRRGRGRQLLLLRLPRRDPYLRRRSRPGFRRRRAVIGRRVETWNGISAETSSSSLRRTVNAPQSSWSLVSKSLSSEGSSVRRPRRCRLPERSPCLVPSSDSTATPCRADSRQSPRSTRLTPPGQPLDHRPERRPELGRRPKGALHVAAAAPSPSRPRSPTPACPDRGWLKIGSAAEAFRQASFSRSQTRARTPTGKAASGRRSRRSLRVSLGPSGKSASSRAASRAAPAARLSVTPEASRE